MKMSSHGSFVFGMTVQMRMFALLEEVDERGVVEGAKPSNEAQRFEPGSYAFGSYRDRAAGVEGDLGGVGTKFEEVVHETHDGGKRPYGGPESDVAELCGHLCVVPEEVVGW